jgi:hypothetical protein
MSSGVEMIDSYPPILHRKTKGDVAEAYVTARLLELGKTVLKPVGDSARYDLVVHDVAAGTFMRVQCKSGYPNPRAHNVMMFAACSSSSHTNAGSGIIAGMRTTSPPGIQALAPCTWFRWNWSEPARHPFASRQQRTGRAEACDSPPTSRFDGGDATSGLSYEFAMRARRYGAWLNGRGPTQFPLALPLGPPENSSISTMGGFPDR